MTPVIRSCDGCRISEGRAIAPSPSDLHRVSAVRPQRCDTESWRRTARRRPDARFQSGDGMKRDGAKVATTDAKRVHLRPASGDRRDAHGVRRCGLLPIDAVLPIAIYSARCVDPSTRLLQHHKLRSGSGRSRRVHQREAQPGANSVRHADHSSGPTNALHERSTLHNVGAFSAATSACAAAQDGGPVRAPHLASNNCAFSA